MESCVAGDTHACYRVIWSESEYIMDKLKEQEKKDKKQEKKEKKESGVSSGDVYRNPSSSNRDRVGSTNSSSNRSRGEELGIGSLVITRRPIDLTCIGFTYCYKYFTSTSGLFIYVFTQAGLRLATFLTVPHEYDIFCRQHEIVFRDEIVFKNVIAKNLTYQELVDSMFSGVGILLDQSLVR